MKGDLNVWKIPIYEPWYRVDKKLKTICRKIKWSFQRITKGYCEYDTWDLDTHYCRYFRDTVEYLRKHCHGYPFGHTEESWDLTLKQMSECFNKAQEDVPNIYEDEYFYANPRTEELRKKYFDEEDRIHKYHQDNLTEGLRLLVKNFNNLWD